MNQYQKPFGVVAIMVYAAIFGTIGIIAGSILLMGTAVAGSAGVLFTLYSIISLVFGVLYWCAFYGLKVLAEWGRQLMFWLSVVAIPLGIIAIFPLFPGAEMTVGNTIYQLVGIGVSGLIIHYLTRPPIRELFL